jgi:parallel beta-helix repeat protein
MSQHSTKEQRMTMRSIVSLRTAGIVLHALALAAGTARAEDISGVIVRRLVLSEDTRLVGDVTCRVERAACIAFGAPGITLHLNGFAITGLADPAQGCSGANVANEFGIGTNGQPGVGIRGPGVVQRFRSSGIAFIDSERGVVELVTASTNCGSGIFLLRSTGVRVEGNVSVRNGVSASGSRGGGITVNGGGDHLIRWNETSGNGYAEPADDYGIGVVAGNNTFIESNTAIGNTNGIALFPSATNTVVRGNVVVGNPPIQLSVSLGGGAGVDILNLSDRGMTTFERNVCLTGVSAPCPDLSPSPIPRRPWP